MNVVVAQQVQEIMAGWQNNVSDTEGNVFLSSITITPCTG
jgi:hypothetical protein